ncbi:MAG: tyrosine-type recombinase/integrase [Clostridia bacterium]|nr:tyrosine-type recombinase/integrase [Clostridia bacterium]
MTNAYEQTSFLTDLSVQPTPNRRSYFTQGNVTYLDNYPPTANTHGPSKEVYAFKDPADLQRMQQFLLTNGSYKRMRLRNWLFFTLGINLGFRVSDLCRLQWQNIYKPHTDTFNLAEWNYLMETKTGKKRPVVINPAAQRAVTYYMQQLGIDPATVNPDDYVFWSNKRSYLHLQPDSIHDILKRAARALQIPFNVGTHSMRKTFGYMLYKATGNNIGIVQKLLNHTDSNTTLRYIGIDYESTKDAYATLPDMVWTPN